MTQNQSTIGLNEIARQKDSICAMGKYDHELQQLVDAEGIAQVAKGGQGIVSDTMFDGEKA